MRRARIGSVVALAVVDLASAGEATEEIGGTVERHQSPVKIRRREKDSPRALLRGDFDFEAEAERWLSLRPRGPA